MNSNDVILEAKDIHARYGIGKAKEILKGLNFSIKRGQCIVIMGENGAGKSTFLKVICGLMVQNSGTIITKGKISYLPETSSIYPYLSAEESIEYFSIFGNNVEDISTIISKLKLPDDSKTASRNYSKGTKRKTSLGMILSLESDIFILDEPFEGLDPKVCEDIVNLILDYKSQSKSFVITSHDLTYTDRIADKVMNLSSGVISGEIYSTGKNGIIMRFSSPVEVVLNFLNENKLIFNAENFPEVEINLNENRKDFVNRVINSGLEFEEIRSINLQDKFRRSKV